MQRGSIRARDVRERLGLPDEDTSLAVLIMKAIVNFVSSNAEKLCMRHVPTIQRVKRSDIWIVEEVHSVDRKVVSGFIVFSFVINLPLFYTVKDTCIHVVPCRCWLHVCCNPNELQSKCISILICWTLLLFL